MKNKLTTVPGFKHCLIQAGLQYWIQKDCPKGFTPDVRLEHHFKLGDEVYRADVYVRYYHSGGHVDYIYEVQGDIDLPSFKKKMLELKSLGDIIPEDLVPDDVIGMEKYLRDCVISPTKKRREE